MNRSAPNKFYEYQQNNVTVNWLIHGITISHNFYTEYLKENGKFKGTILLIINSFDRWNTTFKKVNFRWKITVHILESLQKYFMI